MPPDRFPPPEAPRVPLVDDDDRVREAFPVGRVLCVGRNYAEHAREMGSDPDREPPFFFLKPASAVATGPDVPWPRETDDLHHEVELVLAVDRPLVAVDVPTARAAICACAVGLDLTRRDRQAEAKAGGRPWEAGKVFDGAAVVGPARLGRAVLDAPGAAITLAVDGAPRQSGRLGQMIWSAAEILARASVLFGVRAGDLVFTGTPAGVAALAPGARLEAGIDGLPPLSVRVG
jgi:fumarylpyruvate hydrolase